VQLLQAVLKVHCSEQVFQQSCKPRFEIERNPFLAKESIQINAILFFLYVQYMGGNLRIYIPPPSCFAKHIASFTSIYNFFLNSNICYNYNTRLLKLNKGSYLFVYGEHSIKAKLVNTIRE